MDNLVQTLEGLNSTQEVINNNPGLMETLMSRMGILSPTGLNMVDLSKVHPSQAYHNMEEDHNKEVFTLDAHNRGVLNLADLNRAGLSKTKAILIRIGLKEEDPKVADLKVVDPREPGLKVTLNKGLLNKGLLNKVIPNRDLLSKVIRNKDLLNKGQLNKDLLNKGRLSRHP